jgi:DNA-binding MarR family transcriptional regulator
MDQDAVLYAEEVRAVARFRAALREFERHTEAAAKASGLTPQRYELLLAVEAIASRGTAVTVSDVVGELGVPQSTASDLIARAIAAGLVGRVQRPEDRRSWSLEVTADGRRRLGEAIRRLEQQRSVLRRALMAASRLFPAATVHIR